ncbi:MAG TPA: PVC-type heme-binding CxxCH protein [Verrucomicrobiae bacterium]|nr:PVC-type heme-binding CxxCH protein [Verrucomicrobiae bacterium]
MTNYLKRLAAFFALAACLATIRSEERPEIRVLFLGDSGLHKPIERFKLLQPALEKKKIEVTYTESLDDLNPAKLAGFDCLLIYANHTRISPEQEKALLDFVNEGHGFVPIHCASFCFLNSPRYIELVGAQFKSHGTGGFKETIVNPEHEIMKGLAPIESWDESYVHSKHNPDRVVLAERRDAKGAEPYTWVRAVGKGRVFYTAWGHDQRTWSNNGFQALVARGIRWASANSPDQLKVAGALKPFEYQEAPAPLPNYLPNAKWGTQGEPIRTMQKPLAPEESITHLAVFPGFTKTLVASEPDIFKPIWMSWDERGRLWIAETIDYPNNMQPPGEGHDQIKICEDTDGDGKADKFTVFVDRLSVPTSFVFANGGIIVVHSGKTEFFKDTDGDGKADERRVLFTGWGTGDTHAGPSNLRYGFDGWIWGTVGYSGFRGTVGGKEVRFGQGIYRFKPDGSSLEFVRSSNNNTWGLGFSEENIAFGSTANGNASMYMPIPNRYYEQVNGWSASRLETIADSQRFFPLTEKVRQVDYHGKYTAGAGSAIYTARSFPEEYWNEVQFVAEPTGHLLGQFYLIPHGSDFVAHNAKSFLASDDEWTAPICAEVGPDGALWVIDWYNYIIQHNPTPQGFKTGKGNAYDTPLRDKAHGRIYRITYKEGHPSKQFDLAKADSDQLIEALQSDNMTWRMAAQRLIVDGAKKDLATALCELVSNGEADELGVNAPAIHALWCLADLGMEGDDKVAQATLGALKNQSRGVRRAAVMVLAKTEKSSTALLENGLLDDPDPQVRLAAFLALSEMPASDNAGKAVFEAVAKSENSTDRWIPEAATVAAARNDASFLKAMLTGYKPAANAELRGELGTVVQLVTRHYADRAPVDTIFDILNEIKSAAPAVAVAVMDGLVAGWPEGTAPRIGETEKRSLNELMQGLPESMRDRLLALAQRWGNTELFGQEIADITETLKKQITDGNAAEEARISAAKRLVALNSSGDSEELILRQISLLTPPSLGTGFVNALGQSRDSRMARDVLSHWQELSPVVRRSAVAVMARRPEWANALLEAVERRRIPQTDLAADQWSQLRQNPNREMAARAGRLTQNVSAISKDREEIVKKLMPLANEKGDPIIGKQIFATTCAVCHTFNGEGGKVGPDLSGIAAKGKSEILVDILDPNRSVEANYRLWNATTKTGDTFSGRLDAETQTSIELLDTTGQKHVIQRKDLTNLESSSMSLMPNGFEALPPNDLSALLTFLTQPH